MYFRICHSFQIKCLLGSGKLNTSIKHNTPHSGSLRNQNGSEKNGIILSSGQNALSWEQARNVLLYSSACDVKVSFRCTGFDTLSSFGWEGYSGTQYTVLDFMGRGFCDSGGL